MADAATLSVLLQVKDQLSAGLKNAEGKLNSFSSTVQKHRVGIRNAGLAMGGAMTGFAALAIKNASDLNESMNAVNVVFGEGSKVIQEFGKTSVTSVGMSQAKFNQLAASTGALLNRTGVPLTEVGKMTTDLATRASDLASVYNTEVDEAMSAINQAIRGETEAIRRFGGEVSEAALQQFLMAEGINKNVSEMTAQEKRLYRVQLIMSDTSVVAGDFARTSGEVANQMKIAKEQFTQTSAQLGTALLPIMTKVLNKINSVMQAISKWVEENPKLAKAIMYATVVVGGLSLAVGILATSVIAFQIALGPIGLIIIGITAAIAGVILMFTKWDDMSLKLKVTLGLMLGPIVLIIAAIKNWDKILAVLKKGFTEFAILLPKAVNGILEVVRAVASFLPLNDEMVAGIDRTIAANEAQIESMRRSADQTLDAAFASKEASETVSEASEKASEAVETSALKVGGANDDMQKAIGDTAVVAQDSATDITQANADIVASEVKMVEESKEARMSWADFMKQHTADQFQLEQQALADRVKANMEAGDQILADMIADNAEKKRLQEEELTWQQERASTWEETEKKIQEAVKGTSLGFEMSQDTFDRLVDERVRAMERQKQKIVELRTFIDDPWFEETGMTQQQIQSGTEKAIADAEAIVQATADAAEKEKELDPLRQALKDTGADAHAFNRMMESAKHHAGFMQEEKLAAEAAGVTGAAKTAPGSAAFQAAVDQLVGQQPAGTPLDAAIRAIQGGIYELPKFANGGMSRGGLAVVGERGPELVNLPSGARVHPNAGGSNTFIFNGAVYGVEDLKQVVVEAVRDHAISGGFTGVFGEN